MRKHVVIALAGCLSLTAVSFSQTNPQAPAQGQYSGAAGAAPLPSQNPFLGSVPEGQPSAGVLQLTLADALGRALRQNLGALLSSDNIIAARGEKWKQLSELLPNLTTATSVSAQQESLRARGINFPGAPAIVGPFGVFDTRAYLSQTILNLKSLDNQRAATQSLKAARYNYQAARDLVVLAVGNAYLQALASAARVETAQAQVKTAQRLYDRALDQQKAGTSPAIDTLRARVELQSRRQQLIVAANNLAKDKLALARIIGLPAGQNFDLADRVPYAALPAPDLDESLRRAHASRPDYQSALAQARAAELSRKAAAAEYLPALSVGADLGDIGVNPATSHGTFHVTGTLSLPVFQGGKVHGDVLRAESALRQSRQALEDLRGRIDYEVRTALLDLAAAAEQVEVARSSVELAEQTLQQAQDRFAAGVTDNLEVVQAQESVAAARENYISGLYAHNLAKVTLARALGIAEQGVKDYLKGK